MSAVARRLTTIAVVAAIVAALVAATALPLRRERAHRRAGSAAAGERDGGALLTDVSAASADIATRVKASVVYITARIAPDVETTLAEHALDVPPELLPMLPRLPGFPGVYGSPRPPQGALTSAGSGVIVSADGYVLTNRHVVDRARSVTVRLLDRRELPARVVGADAATDLAVLKIDAPGLVPATLGNSDRTRVGDWVFAVGNPLGEALTFSVTSGIVSAKGRVLDLPNSSPEGIQDFIQTDAAINPGSSGGPLIDARGAVVGVTTALASPTGSYAGYGFAVPINLARAVMWQLTVQGRVERAVLDVRVRDAGSEDATYVGLPEIRGVLVQDVDRAAPAARAGLRAGDVILAVDGQPVDRVAQLQEAITFRRPGSVVSLQVARKDAQRAVIAVALQRAPDDSPDARSLAAPVHAAPTGAPPSLLGVRVLPTGAEAVRALRLPPDVRGLVVVGVADDTPAAGRLASPDDGGPDVILSVEMQAVLTPGALRDALRRAGPGAVVTLALYDVPSHARRVERVRLAGDAGASP
jgi:serine protease Do